MWAHREAHRATRPRHRGALALAALAGCAMAFWGCETAVDVTALTATPAELDFGLTATSLEFSIDLPADQQAAAWTIVGAPDWAALSATSGSGDATITVDIVRSGCGTGAHQAVLNISSDAGNDTVNLEMTVGGG